MDKADMNLEGVEVEERADLLDVEKETYISFDSEMIKQGYCRVCSHHKLIIQQLLESDNADYERAYYDNNKLSYLEATVPLSHLKLKSSGSDDNRLSRVVRN